MIKYELELKTDYFQLWFLYKSDRSIKHNGTIKPNYFRSQDKENIFQIIDRNRFQGHRCESDIDICIYAFSSFKINSAAQVQPLTIFGLANRNPRLNQRSKSFSLCSFYLVICLIQVNVFEAQPYIDRSPKMNETEKAIKLQVDFS